MANVVIKKSSKVCGDLVAQADIYLPEIANKLYGLAPVSGKGKIQPFAPLPPPPPPKSAINGAYTVFLRDSRYGVSGFTPAQNVFTFFTLFVVLFAFWLLLRKYWIYHQKVRELKSSEPRHTFLDAFAFLFFAGTISPRQKMPT